MKGRKPASDTVVPMRQGGETLSDFEARARETAAALKPKGLPDDVSAMWDRLGPPLCMPHRRFPLDEASAYMFEQLCHAAVRLDQLRRAVADEGEVYESEGRQGRQIKNHPNVGQMNECYRQVRSLAAEFGMTPQSARGVQLPGQQAFRFNDDQDDFD